MHFTNLTPGAARHVHQGAAPAAPARQHAPQASEATPVLHTPVLAPPEPQGGVLDTPCVPPELDIHSLDLCSVERAGQMLQIDASLVRRYCRDGKLPAVRVDGVWVLLARDVRAAANGPRRRRGRPAQS